MDTRLKEHRKRMVKIKGCWKRIMVHRDGIAAAVTSLSIDASNNADPGEALENVIKSFIVGFAIGATARNKGEAAKLGTGAGFAMASGELPPEVKERLMQTAKLLAETAGLENLPNNGYYTTSVDGMTLTIDHYGNVYAGISNSIDITQGKDLPMSWTQGYVTYDGIKDEEIENTLMMGALNGGGLTITLHAGGVQYTTGVCLFPDDDEKNGGLKRGYTHEVGFDRQVGISIGAGATEYIDNIYSPTSDTKEEDGLLYGS